MNVLKMLKTPEAAIFAGVVTLAATVGVAVWSGIKASKELEVLESVFKESDILVKDEEKLLEKTKVVLKYGTPVVIGFGLGAAFLLSGTRLQARQLSAATTLYEYTRDRMSSLDSSVRDNVGPRKYANIADKARTNVTPKSDPPLGVFARDDIVVYDELSDRYFRVNDVENVRKAVVTCNEMMYSEGKVTLNDVYDELRLKPVHIGHFVGWTPVGGPIVCELTSRLVSYEGLERPIVMISWNTHPDLVGKEWS